jgi:hypothetical protein
MNQTEDLNVNRSDMVAEAVAQSKKADELRGAAIKHLLAQREQIEQDLKTLGYASATPNGSGALHQAEKRNTGIVPQVMDQQQEQPPRSKRFRTLNLAAIGRILLSEHGTLHGKEIEKLAKVGGFKGGTNNFQNYMPVAFKRAGGFENVGGNRWKLNEDIAPQR